MLRVKLFGLLTALAFLLAPLAPAQAQVTTPYWCGTYYSSYPCTQSSMPYYTGGYGYNNYGSGNYTYYNNQYQQPYNYYQNSGTNGYWGYCYQTNAYGPSYRYPCFYSYSSYSNYNNYYQYYSPYNYNYGNYSYPQQGYMSGGGYY